ncbi:MAG: hypothetical protein IPG09_18295 [Ignavibacteria bacterium]|nr:hypothetical protein [Ignavibacteria bacterium]
MRSIRVIFLIPLTKNLGGKILTVYNDFTNYLNRKKYFEEKYYKTDKPQIAYFRRSTGYRLLKNLFRAVCEVLSGDHMKSSSDLGLPLIGIGLDYHYGFAVDDKFKGLADGTHYETMNFRIFRCISLETIILIP